nr:ECF transporter S component [uncultured Oscillibacter sp.]
MKNTSTNLRTLTQLALLVAIEFAMRALGLGTVPMGPLVMSFLTLPIAVGAIVIGPLAGLVLGGVFGVLSLTDAIAGRSAMTNFFFNIDPVNTVILCVGMRMLMGLCCGFVFKAVRKLDSKGTWSYLVGAISAPLLNTLFFMGYICLVFYHCDYVQNLVTTLGAANPIMFVVLVVGVQGLMEAVVCGVLGSILGKAVDVFAKRQK